MLDQELLVKKIVKYQGEHTNGLTGEVTNYIYPCNGQEKSSDNKEKKLTKLVENYDSALKSIINTIFVHNNLIFLYLGMKKMLQCCIRK